MLDENRGDQRRGDQRPRGGAESHRGVGGAHRRVVSQELSQEPRRQKLGGQGIWDQTRAPHGGSHRRPRWLPVASRDPGTVRL